MDLSWDEQLEEQGYVVFVDWEGSPSDRIAHLGEWDWRPVEWLNTIPSCWWDPEFPTVGGRRDNDVIRAFRKRMFSLDDDEMDDLEDVDEDWYEDEDDEAFV